MKKQVKQMMAKTLGVASIKTGNIHATVDSAWFLNKPKAPKSLLK